MSSLSGVSPASSQTVLPRRYILSVHWGSAGTARPLSALWDEVEECTEPFHVLLTLRSPLLPSHGGLRVHNTMDQRVNQRVYDLWWDISAEVCLNFIQEISMSAVSELLVISYKKTVSVFSNSFRCLGSVFATLL